MCRYKNCKLISTNYYCVSINNIFALQINKTRLNSNIALVNLSFWKILHKYYMNDP